MLWVVLKLKCVAHIVSGCRLIMYAKVCWI